MKALKCKTLGAGACTKHMMFEWYVVRSKGLLKNTTENPLHSRQNGLLLIKQVIVVKA